MALITAFIYIYTQVRLTLCNLIKNILYISIFSRGKSGSINPTAATQLLTWSVSKLKVHNMKSWLLRAYNDTQVYSILLFQHKRYRRAPRSSRLLQKRFTNRHLLPFNIKYSRHSLMSLIFHFTGYQCVPLRDWTCMRCASIARADLLRGCAHSG